MGFLMGVTSRRPGDIVGWLTVNFMPDFMMLPDAQRLPLYSTPGWKSSRLGGSRLGAGKGQSGIGQFSALKNCRRTMSER